MVGRKEERRGRERRDKKAGGSPEERKWERKRGQEQQGPESGPVLVLVLAWEERRPEHEVPEHEALVLEPESWERGRGGSPGEKDRGSG